MEVPTLSASTCNYMCPPKREAEEVGDMPRGEGHMKAEAEIKVPWPPAKEHQGSRQPPAAGRGEGGAPHSGEFPEEASPC